MISLDPGTAAELPIDQLGLLVLEDFSQRGGWNSQSYILEAEQYHGYSSTEAVRALAEASHFSRFFALQCFRPAPGRRLPRPFHHAAPGARPCRESSLPALALTQRCTRIERRALEEFDRAQPGGA